MPDRSLNDAKDRMRKALNALAHEFSTVRTGRASAAVLDGVRVDYYGTPTPISQMAAIKSPEASMLVIEPWDKTALGAIEKAIQASDLGLNPSNDGTLIRLPFPSLNEERRRDLVKQVKHFAEDGKVAVRNVRRDVIEHLKRQEKDGDITQDDLHRAEADIQKLTDAHTREIDEMVKTKEAEIMEV